jgi:hypothetical protein
VALTPTLLPCAGEGPLPTQAPRPYPEAKVGPPYTAATLGMRVSASSTSSRG